YEENMTTNKTIPVCFGGPRQTVIIPIVIAMIVNKINAHTAL
ncbi:unnamed protein product, partial [Rotaria sp. Silwood2]